MLRKKYNPILNKQTMAMPMLAGVGLMMVCCSSSAAAMMMGGDGDDDKKKSQLGPTGPTGPTGPSPVVIRDEQTTENDAGSTGHENSMVHLDRHNVTCGEDGLVGFSLKKTGTDQMFYEYTCRDDINTPLEDEKNTGSNDEGQNNTIFLDRHAMDCGKKAIGQFRLNRPAAGQIMYQYRCSGKATTGTCREGLVAASTKTGHSSTKTTSLDDVHPKCNDDEVLTKAQFQIHQIPGEPDTTGSYKYTCCKM
jgi:hypothetical protein